MVKRFKSLTWKQINLVVFTALFFAVAIFVIEITQTIITTHNQLPITQQELLDSLEQSATNVVWAMDDDLARQILEGVIKIEHMHSATIQLDDNTTFVSLSNTSKLYSKTFTALSNALFSQVNTASRPLYRSLYVDGVQEQQLIGVLTVSYDIGALTNSLFYHLKISFFATLVRALMLTLVVSVIFHRFLTKPIANISAAIDKIDPSDPAANLLPISRAHQDDELGLVTLKFNQILIEFSQTQKSMRAMATRDTLTGLPNRTLLVENIASAIKRATLHTNSFALLFIDLDRFKNINDSLGHAVGDKFLIHIAQLMKEVVNNEGTVARLGGDEFVILTDIINSPDQAAEYANRFLTYLNHPIELDDHVIHPAASIGISIYPDDSHNADDLIRHADIAMYNAKAAGSNQWAFFKQKMTERAAMRLRMEASMHNALKNQEFLLYLQPKIDIQTGKIMGCEALIRWQKNGELISPMAFIPIAEETGIIVLIGHWILAQSCQMLKSWQDQYGYAVPIAINLASAQFAEDNLVTDIKSLLAQYQIPPALLEIEITETSLMDDIDIAVNKLAQLKAAGFGIAIDDFGTGYSSLSYLRDLPITTMKIDRCFISDLPKENAIASTILMLGKQLKLKIVAEGIENVEQLTWLKENNCDIGQGFYFSKPLPQIEFEQSYLAKQANS